MKLPTHTLTVLLFAVILNVGTCEVPKEPPVTSTDTNTTNNLESIECKEVKPRMTRQNHPEVPNVSSNEQPRPHGVDLTGSSDVIKHQELATGKTKMQVP